MTKRNAFLVIAVIFAGLAAGCGDGDGPRDDIGIGDTGFDAVEPADTVGDPGAVDTGVDIGVIDTGVDTGDDIPVVTDSGTDTGNDGVEPADDGGDAVEPIDTGSDDVWPADVATDAGTDVPTDIAEDAPTDTESDYGQDVSADTGAGDLPGTDTPADDVSPDAAVADDGTDAAQDTYQPPETVAINGVFPESAIENTAFTLTVIGTGLTSGMTIRLVGDNAITAGYMATPDTSVLLEQGHRIDASFTAANGLIRGYYRVELLDGSDVADSLSGFRILAAGGTAPTVLTVTPDTAKSGRDRMVTVTGAGFAPGATVVLAGYGEVYECSYVEVADQATLTAVVQAGTSRIPIGEYAFRVVNPDGLVGEWPSKFTVTDVAPPAITSVSPVRSGNATAVPLTVTGRDFQEGALVSLVVGDGELALDTTVVTAGSVLGATVPSGMAAGIYPVRVTNPDAQFDTFYFYQSSNNSPGSLTTFESMTSKLNIPRWQHGLDAMVDGMGHGFLVATGGLDSSGIPIDDVEISQVSPNGTPGAWFVPVQTDPLTGLRITNRMAEPRSGAATVRVGKTLFVAGGRSLPDPASQAVDSIEIARMLTGSGAPHLRAPQLAAGGGFLPDGRWLYRVSAVTPAGETLASSSVSYRGNGGALSMSWEPVKDAVGYNIYRCPAANCTYGQEIAISWMAPAASKSFTDDGAGYLTPSPSGLDAMAYPDNPLAITLVTYSYMVTSVADIDETNVFESVPGSPKLVDVPGGTGVVSLVWNDVAAAGSYRVYRATADGEHRLIAEVPAGTTFWDDTLDPAVLPQTPPAAVTPLPTGSLSLFDYARGDDGQPLLLNIPREGARATYVETQFDETDPAALIGVLFVIGGRTGFEPLPSSEKSVESIRFFIDGSLAGPDVEALELRTGRSFFGMGNSQDRLDNLTFEDDDDDDPVTPDCPDADLDGFFDAACGGTDCDDTNMMINPAAWEDLQNGIDDNCDGLVDVPTQGWEFTGGGGIPDGAPLTRALDPYPEPVFLIAMLGNDDIVATGDTGLNDIEAVGVDLYTGALKELNTPVSGLFTLETNSDNSDVHGLNVALYQKYLFSFMGVGSENLGQVPGNLIAQSKRFPFCPPPEPGDPGDSSFGCPGYSTWTYADLAGVKRTSANATVSGGLGYYGLSRAFGYIYLVAGVTSGGVGAGTWRVLQ